MTTRRVAALVLTVVCLVGACGGGDGSGEAAPETTEEEETTTTEVEMTNQQAVALIAGELEGVEGVLADVDTFGCSAPLVSVGLTCSATLMSLSLSAQTLSLTTNAVFLNEDALNHEGPPPAELEDLVDDTIAAADELAAEADNGADCAMGNCPEGAFGLSLAIGEMEDVIAAWGVYGL